MACNRITTVEQLISQSPGRIILLSEERNKKYGEIAANRLSQEILSLWEGDTV